MTPIGANIRRLTGVIALAFLITSVGVGYWTGFRETEVGGRGRAAPRC